jgi:hypothetical protein
MNRWLLRSLPADFRSRYGDELLDLLTASDSQARDSLDLIVLAIRLNTEGLMVGTLRYAGMALILFGIFASGYAASDLAGGISEMHRHWWSTAPVVFALAGGGLTLVANRLCAVRRPAT